MKHFLENIAVVITVLGGIVGLYAVMPDAAKVATQGWVLSQFGSNVERVDYVYSNILVRNISVFNARICQGRDSPADHTALQEDYRRYRKVYNADHEYFGMAPSDICERLGE